MDRREWAAVLLIVPEDYEHLATLPATLGQVEYVSRRTISNVGGHFTGNYPLHA